MFKTSLFVALGLTLASLTSAQTADSAAIPSVQNPDSTSLNQTGLGATQPTTVTAEPPFDPSAKSGYEFSYPKEIPIRAVPLEAVPANYRIQLKSLTDDYTLAKRQAIGFGLAAIAMEATAYAFFGSNSSAPPAYFNILTIGAGASGLASLVRTINAISRGSQLGRYEDKIRYRISLSPVVVPRAGGVGALASVSF